MTKPSETPILSSYAKLSLSQWQVLADLIRDYSTPTKAQGSEAELDTNIAPNTQQQTLEIKQINDAIDGPMQAFFRDKISAYASLSQVKMALKIASDDNFKENLSPSNIPVLLEPKQLGNIDTDTLDITQQQLDQLTTEHKLQWQQHFADWSTLVAQKINAVGLNLNMIEIAELQTLEPMSELWERYLTLNLERPKINQATMDYQQYLMLKSHLAIYSSLSRQHQPHQKKDIHTYIKQLSKDLNAIHDAEKQLIKTQAEETKEALSALPTEKK